MSQGFRVWVLDGESEQHGRGNFTALTAARPALEVAVMGSGFGAKIVVGPTLAHPIEEALQLRDHDVGFGRAREVSACGTHHKLGF